MMREYEVGDPRGVHPLGHDGAVGPIVENPSKFFANSNVMKSSDFASRFGFRWRMYIAVFFPGMAAHAGFPSRTGWKRFSLRYRRMAGLAIIVTRWTISIRFLRDPCQK